MWVVSTVVNRKSQEGCVRQLAQILKLGGETSKWWMENKNPSHVPKSEKGREDLRAGVEDVGFRGWVGCVNVSWREAHRTGAGEGRIEWEFLILSGDLAKGTRFKTDGFQLCISPRTLKFPSSLIMGTEALGLEEGQRQGTWWVVKVDIIVNLKTKDKQICNLVLVDELQASLADGDTYLVVYLKDVWFKIKKTKKHLPRSHALPSLFCLTGHCYESI